MDAPARPAPSPRFARNLSTVNLLVWVGLPGLVVAAMASSGSNPSLGGLAFLGTLFAFLGGVGIVGALVGYRRATLAYGALARDDAEGVRRQTRASVRANLLGAGLQLALFVLGVLALTHLHH
jgi:hypothetical protein